MTIHKALTDWENKTCLINCRILKPFDIKHGDVKNQIKNTKVTLTNI